MASGSAMQQDSLLVSLDGDGTSVLPPLAHFGFGVKKQIKRQPMAGELAPEGPARTQVRDGRSSGRSIIHGVFQAQHLQVVVVIQLRLQEPVSALSALMSLSISRLLWAPGRGYRHLGHGGSVSTYQDKLSYENTRSPNRRTRSRHR
jgi:hypothetical protein